jgi:hypothetical protein
MIDLHLSEEAYICSMDWRAKHLVSAQALSPVAGGLYEGQLVVWDVPDAHNDVFTRQTKFHIYGEPPVYLEHNYFAPPVGKIVHFSEREDGLYVALKLERPIEDVKGVHLSVGGFAIGSVREDGAYEIKEFAVFEASLTPTPAQPNSEIVLLMKTLEDMAAENKKTMPAEVVEPTTQKAVVSANPISYVRKQDLAQLEAFVTELAARVEALEELPAQLANISQRLTELEAALAQIQSMMQDSATQAVEKSLKVVQEQVQPFAKELAKTMLLVAEALKKTNNQKI